MEKREIRTRILRLRKEMDYETWQDCTDAITEKVLGSAWFQEAGDIYCYVDCKGEAGTRKIIEEAWRCKKRVYVPRVEGEEMEFYRIHSFDQLHIGGFGIPEPDARQAPAGEAGAAEDAAGKGGFCGKDRLMIMPGVAFDIRLNRAGYGKGYYDRYLKRHPELRTIAIAFDMQVTEAVIEHTPQDVRPRMLVTENRMLGESTVSQIRSKSDRVKGDEDSDADRTAKRSGTAS